MCMRVFVRGIIKYNILTNVMFIFSFDVLDNLD